MKHDKNYIVIHGNRYLIPTIVKQYIEKLRREIKQLRVLIDE